MSNYDNLNEAQAKEALHKESITCGAVKSKLWHTGQQLKETARTLDMALNRLFAKVDDIEEAMVLAKELELHGAFYIGEQGWIDKYYNKAGKAHWAHYMGNPFADSLTYCGKAQRPPTGRPNRYDTVITIGEVCDSVIGWEYDPTPAYWRHKFKPTLAKDAVFQTKLARYLSYCPAANKKPPVSFWNNNVSKFNDWKRGLEQPD
tara:strand:+ start:216 stop:827 length:612 start_codon:yes stop_codon:yes gene_type:complete